EIYVMNSDGSNQSRLTNNAANDNYPAFSPDGSRIAFSSERDSGLDEIYVMNSDGSSQTRLTNSVDGYEREDTTDNCPLAANADQADFDMDGIGDTCDPQTGPPSNKEQCKDGGWMRFDFPPRFIIRATVHSSSSAGSKHRRRFSAADLKTAGNFSPAVFTRRSYS
ncbi:MAG: hypothetical protein M3430_02860, partial [Acidobacteriota bacterium]|nr:hypothetical protein [Acidobacteriota bacterium]